jgi:hypothetical protein
MGRGGVRDVSGRRVWWGSDGAAAPVLTAEAGKKWYGLVLVDGARCLDVPFPGPEFFPTQDGAGMNDGHVPHPTATKALALARGWVLDPVAEREVLDLWCCYQLDCECVDVEGRDVYVRQVAPDHWVAAENPLTGEGLVANGRTRAECLGWVAATYRSEVLA